MAPQRPRKSKSTVSGSASSVGLERFPTPPRLVPTKSGLTPSKTLLQSPSKRQVRITLAQKQAILENLQLEITERARKLRAQYVLRTQGLRSRLEMRIHRIPAALRAVTIAELLDKQARKEREIHEQKLKAFEDAKLSTIDMPRPATAKSAQTQKHETKVFEDPSPKGTKRTSNDMNGADKENAAIANPRKRSKAAIEPEPRKKTSGSQRNMSKKMPASREILSPKSNNSRALPSSPSKITGFTASPQKSNIARPVSPLKPMPTTVVAQTASSLAKTADKTKGKAANSRAASRQGAIATGGRPKRALAATAAEGGDDAHGRVSTASDRTNESAGTTIVKRTNSKVAVPGKAAPVAAKKTAGTVKKLVAGLESKKDTTASKVGKAHPTTGSIRGGRTLRKRP